MWHQLFWALTWSSSYVRALGNMTFIKIWETEREQLWHWEEHVALLPAVCYTVTWWPCTPGKGTESWSLQSLRGVRWCPAALCHLPGADVEAELWLCCCSLGASQAPKEHPEQGAGTTSHAQQGSGHRKAVLLRRWLGYNSSSPAALPRLVLQQHCLHTGSQSSRGFPGQHVSQLLPKAGGTLQGLEMFPAMLGCLTRSPTDGFWQSLSLPTTEIKTCLLSHSCSSEVLPSLQGLFPLEWYSQVFKEILLLKSDMMDVLAQHKCKHPWASWESFCLQLSGCNTDPSPKLCLEVLHDT